MEFNDIWDRIKPGDDVIVVRKNTNTYFEGKVTKKLEPRFFHRNRTIEISYLYKITCDTLNTQYDIYLKDDEGYKARKIHIAKYKVIKKAFSGDYFPTHVVDEIYDKLLPEIKKLDIDSDDWKNQERYYK